MISSAFKVKVNGQEEISLQEDQIGDMNNIKITDGTYHILQEKKSYFAKISQKDFNNRSYEIRIGSNTYHVNIETELDELIQSMGYRLGSEQATDTIKAPMPGIILDVRIKQGDSVKKGDTLLILEAMKMENAILSPKDGVVKQILSKTGETVDKNKLLIELE
jgi:biotin carboxyl carrier protein